MTEDKESDGQDVIDAVEFEDSDDTSDGNKGFVYFHWIS